MDFKSYSQIAQDKWVYEQLVLGRGITRGTFLDVGCNDPMSISNTYALEQLGWTGILMDSSNALCQKCREQRTSRVIETDCTTFDFRTIKAHYDYLSLDIDDGQVKSCERILEAGISFTLATVEHDSYRVGEVPKAKLREMLLGAGYRIWPYDLEQHFYEDWWFKNP